MLDGVPIVRRDDVEEAAAAAVAHDLHGRVVLPADRPVGIEQEQRPDDLLDLCIDGTEGAKLAPQGRQCVRPLKHETRLPVSI